MHGSKKPNYLPTIVILGGVRGNCRRAVAWAGQPVLPLQLLASSIGRQPLAACAWGALRWAGALRWPMRASGRLLGGQSPGCGGSCGQGGPSEFVLRATG